MAKDYVEGGKNVFADLGLPAPDELLVKAELARRIGVLVEARGLNQEEAARVLQIDQPKVSALKRGRLAGFSIERLMRFLVLLGNDVEIVVKERPRSRTQARLRVA
jgi:predicted XRE-type DNA-binding protein